MKILLINYRYFVSGGPERYMFNVKNALEEEGHEIIPFSIRYPQNEDSQYSEYFVSPLDDSGSVYYDEHKSNIKTIAKTISRLFYSKEVEHALSALIDDTKPDIAYVLHYMRKLSPSVLVALKKAGIPIIVRLSDYQMLCPQAHCIRDGKVCELCLTETKTHSIKHQCVKGSMPASILNYIAESYHEASGFYKYIDKFVVTNDFTMKQMIKAGQDGSRFCIIPTFTEQLPIENTSKTKQIVYAGRLDEIKGVDVAIKAFIELANTPFFKEYTLAIAGEGTKQYHDKLIEIVASSNVADRITFLGHVDQHEISHLLAASQLALVPSTCFENLPNIVLESFAVGTPVLASNIGSLSQMVVPGRTGDLFKVGDPIDLADKMAALLSDLSTLNKMSIFCKQEIQSNYTKENHIQKLSKLFFETTQNKCKYK